MKFSKKVPVLLSTAILTVMSTVSLNDKQKNNTVNAVSVTNLSTDKINSISVYATKASDIKTEVNGKTTKQSDNDSENNIDISSADTTTINAVVHKGDSLLEIANENNADVSKSAKMSKLALDTEFNSDKVIELVISGKNSEQTIKDNTNALKKYQKNKELDDKADAEARKIAENNKKYDEQEKQFNDKLDALTKQATEENTEDEGTTNDSGNSSENNSSAENSSDNNSENSAGTDNSGSQSGNNVSSVTNADNLTGQALKNYVLSKMSAGTGVSRTQWDKVITAESGWNKSIYNSLGYYGLFQLAPGYPGNGKGVDAQIRNAIYLYKVQGPGAWVTWYL